MEVDKWISDLEEGKLLSERDIKQLCLKVSEILSEVGDLFRSLIACQSPVR